MIAGANKQGHWQTLNGQTIGGAYVSAAHGSTLAGPMWGDAMKTIQKWLPNKNFKAPDPRTIKGQQVTVPSVYGMDPQAAAKRLRQAGLFPTVGPTVDSSYPAGTVAYLSPGSGSQIGSGSSITIYVSDGTPYVAPAPPPTDNGNDGGNGGDNGGNDGGNGGDNGGGHGGGGPGGGNGGGNDGGGGGGDNRGGGPKPPGGGR
jgi:hypothetical protein